MVADRAMKIRRLAPALAIDLAAARSGSRDAACSHLLDHGTWPDAHGTLRHAFEAERELSPQHGAGLARCSSRWVLSGRNDELGGQRRRAAPPAFELEVLKRQARKPEARSGCGAMRGWRPAFALAGRAVPGAFRALPIWPRWGAAIGGSPGTDEGATNRIAA